MKLLICEDDISTIEVIKKNINFGKYDIDTVLEAYNGQMALEVISSHNPEIILCDIGMPKLRGTEVLKFARKNNPNVEFSFLTCYENFNYAQLAIEYQASGYITKPFRLKQVEDILEKMSKNYKEKVKNNREETQIKLDLVSSSVFRQISDGVYGTDRDMIESFLESNEMSFTADKSFRIIFTCLNIFDTLNSTWSKDLLLFTAPRVHDETLNNYIGAANSIVNCDDRFLWCITFVKDDITTFEIDNRCERLKDFFKEYFMIQPVVLISDPFVFYNAYDVLTKLYEKIRKIRFYEGRTFYQNEEITELENENIINDHQLLWYLKNRDEVGYEEYLNNVLTIVEKNNSYDQFKKELSLFFFTVFKDNDLPNSCIYESEIIQDLEKKENNSKNIIAYAKELLNIYQSQMSTLYDSEDIISRAKKFVDDNYRDNIDRDDVAEVAFVTPNYLSKLFRNNMGMNLREYINQLRIEESKRLLLSTNMSISEIAIYVGYYNISYFSTVFHKLVGVSPVDWRNSGKENA